MRVFLTGLTGYIGQKLGLKLAENGMKVHCLVRDIRSRNIPEHKNIKIFEGDICDYSAVRECVEGCQYSFHTAALTNLKCRDVKKFYCSNVTGTRNILEASLGAGVEKVIYTSTLSVYGSALKSVPITETQPRVGPFTNDYELTKSISEEVVEEYVSKGLPCVILNVTRVYGPGTKTFSNGVNRLIEKFIDGKYLIVPNQLNKRANYVFIDDVIQAHLNAVSSGKNGERYIIGGENVDYHGLFDKIKMVTGNQSRILSVDYDALKYGIISLERINRLLGYEPPINRKILESLFVDRPASSKKAINELGHKITPLEKGLIKTVEHLKN